MGWWYNWCYEYGYECTGGYYEEDNSYCEESATPPPPECSGMRQIQCNNNSDCQWTEDTAIGDCDDINNGSDCYAIDECTWYSSGNYGYGFDGCYGGSYEIDNSYCEEIEFQLGDINGDYFINILDIIETIDLILEGEYDYIVDMDGNSDINILDIIQMISIILNGE